MSPPPFTRSDQSLPRYLLQSTVYLLPIMPSDARACGRPSSRPWRYDSIIAAASASVITPCRDQPVGVDLARGRMLADDLVHHRLRGRRLIRFVVAVAAVTDEVDDDVLVEMLAILEREARDEHHRFRIVPVHVEDRRLEHLRDVGAVHRRARVARIRGGETDLVVDDDVDGAAGVERARLRELQRLHDDALAGEGRIAVDEDRQHAGAGGVAAAFLARAHRSFDHRD